MFLWHIFTVISLVQIRFPRNVHDRDAGEDGCERGGLGQAHLPAGSLELVGLRGGGDRHGNYKLRRKLVRSQSFQGSQGFQVRLYYTR